jgi:hypothetical protein
VCWRRLGYLHWLHHRGEVTTHNIRKRYGGCEVLKTAIIKEYSVLRCMTVVWIETDVSEERIASILSFAPVSADFLTFLLLNHKDGKICSSELHGITTQKSIHFIGYATRTLSQVIHTSASEWARRAHILYVHEPLSVSLLYK